MPVRNLAHARGLHAFNVGLKDYKLRCEKGTQSSAAKSKMDGMYRTVKDGQRGFDDDMKQLGVRERKAGNTALLARALLPSWQPRSSSALQEAIQRHDPPDKYEHRSSIAVFWINMHRLAIGDEAFTAEGFVSLTGDAVKRFS